MKEKSVTDGELLVLAGEMADFLEYQVYLCACISVFSFHVCQFLRLFECHREAESKRR